MIGGARLDIRLQAAERFRIGMEDPDHLVGERADIDAELGGARVYPVVDVGNVADIGDVIRPIKVPQKPEQHVEDDEHTAVADMQMIVDGGAAGIDANVFAIDRLEPLFFSRQGVVEPGVLSSLFPSPSGSLLSHSYPTTSPIVSPTLYPVPLKNGRLVVEILVKVIC